MRYKQINYLNKTPEDVKSLIELGTYTNGLYNTIKEDELNPTYEIAENEIVYSNKNSHIILGKDRFGDYKTGFGGLGYAASNAVDIVVGLASSYMPLDKKLGPTDEIGKNFFTDAARVYISQRCDIDKYFAIEEGTQYSDFGNEGVSGAAIKADCVAVIGRRNVKIKAGPSRLNIGKEKDSQGQKITDSRIELIGGNKDLEPLVLGFKLVKLLKEMQEEIQYLRGEVTNLHYKNAKLNTKLALHIHGDPFTVVTLPSPDLAVSAIIEIPQNIQNVVKGIVDKYIDKVRELNSTQIPNDADYILSRNVFTT
tara:strand:+ start:27295 stop:28224 length:930 start_codon:yes stop_codon:yes gene_type:complete